jgi:hypothetical protein
MVDETFSVSSMLFLTQCGVILLRLFGVSRGHLTLDRDSLSSSRLKFLLGHSSIQTTERYLGSEQDIEIAVNDNLGL